MMRPLHCYKNIQLDYSFSIIFNTIKKKYLFKLTNETVSKGLFTLSQSVFAWKIGMGSVYWGNSSRIAWCEWCNCIPSKQVSVWTQHKSIWNTAWVSVWFAASCSKWNTAWVCFWFNVPSSRRHIAWVCVRFTVPYSRWNTARVCVWFTDPRSRWHIAWVYVWFTDPHSRWHT